MAALSEAKSRPSGRLIQVDDDGGCDGDGDGGDGDGGGVVVVVVVVVVIVIVVVVFGGFICYLNVFH